MGGIGLLLGLLLLAGVLGLNGKVTASIMPYFITAGLTIRHHRRMRSAI